MFSTFYDETTKESTCYDTCVEMIVDGASIWWHRPSQRGLIKTGEDSFKISSDTFYSLLRDGVVVEDEYPMDLETSILIHSSMYNMPSCMKGYKVAIL